MGLLLEKGLLAVQHHPLDIQERGAQKWGCREALAAAVRQRAGVATLEYGRPMAEGAAEHHSTLRRHVGPVEDGADRRQAWAKRPVQPEEHEQVARLELDFADAIGARRPELVIGPFQV